MNASVIGVNKNSKTPSLAWNVRSDDDENNKIHCDTIENYSQGYHLFSIKEVSYKYLLY
jgi:hypothetical protein